jgi:hypothetical protein
MKSSKKTKNKILRTTSWKFKNYEEMEFFFLKDCVVQFCEKCNKTTIQQKVGYISINERTRCLNCHQEIEEGLNFT